jgi:hypothetical protein
MFRVRREIAFAVGFSRENFVCLIVAKSGKTQAGCAKEETKGKEEN